MDQKIYIPKVKYILAKGIIKICKPYVSEGPFENFHVRKNGSKDSKDQRCNKGS